MTSLGDGAQIRAIGEQIGEAVGDAVADRAIAKFMKVHGEEMAIPPPFTWGAKIIAGVFTIGTGAFVFWMVTTLNDMQLAMQEVRTQLGQSGAVEARFQDINRRIDRLEEYHKGGR